jgi:hypothetical protein
METSKKERVRSPEPINHKYERRILYDSELVLGRNDC